jgi:Protein of unknown function (DUF2800)
MTPEQSAILQRLLNVSKGDALFRPSSASGWLKCHGRVQLSALAPKGERRSAYADEGTAAHIVLNEALSGQRQPHEWTDRMVRIDDLTGVFVDEEMAESIEWCVDRVIDLMGDDPGTELFLEYRLTLAALDPTDPLLAQNRGTADVILVNRPKRSLKIIDLKYGKGVMVAGDSPQLLDYGLMGLVTWGVDGGWESVESVILQPRAAAEHERYKAVALSPDDLLMTFLGTVVGAMEAALEPDPPLLVGDHCRWCPARPVCPALREQALAIGGDAHAAPTALARVSSMLTPIPPMPSLAEPRSLSGSDLATILDRRAIYDSWIESVEQAASRLLDIGGVVPGWGLRSRSGHRKFKDLDEAMRVLSTEGGLTAAQFMTEPKLRSPRQIEKILSPSKRSLLDAAAANSLVETPRGAPQLVRLTSADQVRTDVKAMLSPVAMEARA